MDVIFDIDGTLCDVEHRRHHVAGPGKKDWMAFNAAMVRDQPRQVVVDAAIMLSRGGARIILATGREEIYRGRTTAQMVLFGGRILAEAPLYMRPEKDYRTDVVVKRELLDRIRDDGFSPVLAIDDRSSVVAMWREAGLVCFQCDRGDF